MPEWIIEIYCRWERRLIKTIIIKYNSTLKKQSLLNITEGLSWSSIENKKKLILYKMIDWLSLEII